MLAYAAGTNAKEEVDYSKTTPPGHLSVGRKGPALQQLDEAMASTQTNVEHVPMVNEATNGAKGQLDLRKEHTNILVGSQSSKLVGLHVPSRIPDASSSTQGQETAQQDSNMTMQTREASTHPRDDSPSLFVALQSLFHHMAILTSMSSTYRFEAPKMTTSSSLSSGGISSGLGRKGSSRPSTASATGRNAGPTLNSVPPVSASPLPSTTSSSTKMGNSSAAVTVDAQAVKKFLVSLKKANILFDTTMHQDAHEMLNFLLNRVGEDIIEAAGTNAATKAEPIGTKAKVQQIGENGRTCVHRLFEGILTNETRCLTCESVSLATAEHGR